MCIDVGLGSFLTDSEGNPSPTTHYRKAETASTVSREGFLENKAIGDQNKAQRRFASTFEVQVRVSLPEGGKLVLSSCGLIAYEDLQIRIWVRNASLLIVHECRWGIFLHGSKRYGFCLTSMS